MKHHIHGTLMNLILEQNVFAVEADYILSHSLYSMWWISINDIYIRLIFRLMEGEF